MPQIIPIPTNAEQDLIDRGIDPDRAWSIARRCAAALALFMATAAPQVMIDDGGVRPRWNHPIASGSFQIIQAQARFLLIGL